MVKVKIIQATHFAPLGAIVEIDKETAELYNDCITTDFKETKQEAPAESAVDEAPDKAVDPKKVSKK